MNASGNDVEYSEAVMVRCIAMIMHYYPKYEKEDILNFTQSYIWTLIEMVGLTKNPEWLKKYKPLKFWNELEFEQYILNKFKMT